jgi:hypothetical protein
VLRIIATTVLAGGIFAIAQIPQSGPAHPASLAYKTDRLETVIEASVRNYLSPRHDGRPIAFCLAAGKRCGKEAADAFCRGNGFTEAMTFERHGAQTDPALLEFRQIKCRRPAAALEQDVIIEFAGAAASNLAAKSDRL